MVKPKHRSLVFPVMRHDFSGNDVCCAVAADPETADNLVGEFSQRFLDQGFKEEEVYFYATTTAFYTR